MHEQHKQAKHLPIATCKYAANIICSVLSWSLFGFGTLIGVFCNLATILTCSQCWVCSMAAACKARRLITEQTHLQQPGKTKVLKLEVMVRQWSCNLLWCGHWACSPVVRLALEAAGIEQTQSSTVANLLQYPANKSKIQVLA